MRNEIKVINLNSPIDLTIDYDLRKIYLLDKNKQIFGDGIILPQSANNFQTITDENGVTYLYLTCDGSVVGEGIKLITQNNLDKELSVFKEIIDKDIVSKIENLEKNKQDNLKSGKGITIEDNIISITGETDVEANNGQGTSGTLFTLKVGGVNYKLPDEVEIPKINVVDNLYSYENNNALSANQGRVLNEKIKKNTNSIINLNESITSNTESINDLQQQMEDLEFSSDEINQIKSDINTIKNETLVELNAQVVLNTQDISRLENTSTQLDDKVDTFDNRITNNSNAINEHTININTLRAGVLSNENAIIALRDDLNSLEINPDEINSLKNQVTQATEKVEEIESTVDSLDNRVKENTERSEQNELKIESNADRIKTNQEKIQELEEKIDNNIPSNEEINQMKQDIEDNKTAISKNEQNISTNNALINTVIGTLEDFETLITTNTTNIEENKQDINTNTQQIENINKRLDNFNIQPEDIQQLKQSVENLSKEIPDIKSDIENNQTLIQSNKTNIDNHTEILNTHTTNINENTTTIQQHNQEIETINDKINKLNLSPDDVANLKESVEQFNVDINNLQESVTKNTSNIAINTENITDNYSKIETNRLNIESNLQKINTNSENIAKNATDISNKQEQLVAGVNIKTFNGQSLLGEGNIEFAGANFDNQLSLESENAVQNKVITEALNEKVGLKGDEFIEGQKTFDNIPLVNTAVKLPDGYIPLTYVGVKNPHDGYPYFLTNMGLLVNYNDSFHFHIKFKRGGDYFGVVFYVPEFEFHINNNSSMVLIYKSTTRNINLTNDIGEIITLDIEYSVSLRRLSYTISNSTTTISDFFESEMAWSSYMTATLLNKDKGYSAYEYLELWEIKDNILSNNLVPSLRQSDNMAGFYDVVNNVFTINARETMQGISYGEELKIIEKLALQSEIKNIVIDKELSLESENPVANSIITKSLDNKVGIQGNDNIYGVKSFAERPILGISDGIILPIEYQRLDYIESTGSQYIDTLVYPNKSPYFKLKFKIEFTNLEDRYLYSAGSSPWFSFERNNTNFYWNTGSTTFLGIHSLDVNTLYEYEITYSNGTMTSSGAYNFTASYSGQLGNDTLRFFGTGTSNTVCRLYELQLYNSENFVLVRDFIPCYRKLDGEIGLYDLVNNNFYTNLGTGEFIKGSDILTGEYFALESQIPQIEINNGKPTTETMSTFSFNGVNYALPSGGEGGGSSGEISFENEVTLWENPNSSVEFPSQVITLNDYSSYDLVGIYFRSRNVGGYGGEELKLVKLEQNGLYELLGTNAASYNLQRYLHLTTGNANEIQVDDCLEIKTHTKNNGYLIPTRIVGLNFTSSSTGGSVVISGEKWVDGGNITIVDTKDSSEVTIDISTFISDYDENAQYELLLNYLLYSSSNNALYLESDIVSKFELTDAGSGTGIDYQRGATILPVKRYFKHSLVTTPTALNLKLIAYKKIVDNVISPSGGNSVEINSTDKPVGVADYIKVNDINYKIQGIKIRRL